MAMLNTLTHKVLTQKLNKYKTAKTPTVAGLCCHLDCTLTELNRLMTRRDQCGRQARLLYNYIVRFWSEQTLSNSSAAVILKTLDNWDWTNHFIKPKDG